MDVTVNCVDTIDYRINENTEINVTIINKELKVEDYIE